jgi:hypothetical protein
VGDDIDTNRTIIKSATSNGFVYLWENITSDNLEEIAFENNSLLKVRISASKPGDYIIQLAINDIAGNKSKDTFNLRLLNIGVATNELD